MKYCSQCSSLVTRKIPEDDNRLRYVCESCNTIHYENPKIVCGCLPEWEDKILICKRAIEPRANYWTLPAGFMELQESCDEGAIRETWEEARARVEVLGLYCVYSLPYAGQVHMLFRSRLLDLDYEPGPESTDVKLVSEAEIPWQEIAFATIRQTLKFYYEDRKTNQFPTRFGDIIKTGNKYCYQSTDK